MFDMGFIKDLRRILRRCPPYNKRQTLLFSATLSIRVMELAYEHTNNAEKVEIEPERVLAHGITELLFHVSSSEKFRLLLGLLEKEGGSRVLIFVNRRTTAADLVRGLSANGYPTRALAGNVPQDRRLKMLDEFKDGRLAVLVATDVASRGLHIEGVSHVINYDLPEDSEDYVHRIGRTGRRGRPRAPRCPSRATTTCFRSTRSRSASAARSRSSGRRRACSARAASPRRPVPTRASGPAPTPAASRHPSQSRPQRRISAGRSARAAEGRSRTARSFRQPLPKTRGANSLPTEGREEVRAAGAAAQRRDQANGRARTRASRSAGAPQAQIP